LTEIFKNQAVNPSWLLFNLKPLKSIDEVRNEVRNLVARQKKRSADDLTAFKGEIEELLLLQELKRKKYRAT